MTNLLSLYRPETLAPYLNPRPGETKFGEAVDTLSHWDQLESHPVHYVLLGIPEDIGVRANYGRAGTALAWEAGLSALLNIQANAHTQPSSLLVLGAIDCSLQMEQAAQVETTDPHRFEKWGALVSQIDEKVARVVRTVVAAGKVPIIIGGGHNNSFGNLKGTSKALGAAVNCINLDAHSDYRPLEHRHSGNGFSYAAKDGYLNHYYIVGLHQNYTSSSLFSTFDTQNDSIRYSLFEDFAVQKTKTFTEVLAEAERFCTDGSFGLELDMDAIINMGSSAMSPSGISLGEARSFLRYFSKHKNCRYIHICEGAPNREIFENQVGKAIAYLVSDVVRA
jgi:formiminoglutamase